MNRLHERFCRSDRWRDLTHERILPKVFAGLDLSGRVLELGPGPGVTTAWLAGQAGSLTAVDVDPDAVRRLQARHPDIEARAVDATDLPFESGAFDVVASCTMLHHLPGPEAQARLIAEAARVLTPGGWFCGFDTTKRALLRLAHLGDTYRPMDPTWLASTIGDHFTQVVTIPGRRVTTFRARASLLG